MAYSVLRRTAERVLLGLHEYWHRCTFGYTSQSTKTIGAGPIEYSLVYTRTEYSSTHVYSSTGIAVLFGTPHKVLKTIGAGPTY